VVWLEVGYDPSFRPVTGSCGTQLMGLLLGLVALFLWTPFLHLLTSLL